MNGINSKQAIDPSLLLLNSTHNTHYRDMAIAMQLVRDMIQPTLGPYGNTAMIHDPNRVAGTNSNRDGASVWASFGASKPEGVKSFIRYLSESTDTMVYRVGDGTSSGILTTSYLVSRLSEFASVTNVIDNTRVLDGIAATQIRFVLESVREVVLKRLKSIARKPTTRTELLKDLESVIYTSSGGDLELVDSLMEVWYTVQDEEISRVPNYVISDTPQVGPDRIERVRGYHFDKKPISRWCYNKESSGDVLEAKYSNGRVFVTANEYDNDTHHMMKENLMRLNREGTPIIIIAPTFAESITKRIEQLMIESIRAYQNNPEENAPPHQIIMLRVPNNSPETTAVFRDIAAVACCKIYDRNPGARATMKTDQYTKEITFEGLGRFKDFNARNSYESDTIIVGVDDNPVGDLRINELKSQLEQVENESETNYDNRKIKINEIKNRIMAMTHGIVKIHPGGATYAENTRRRELYDDSMRASEHALKGTLPGGNLATYSLLCRKEIKSQVKNCALNLGFNMDNDYFDVVYGIIKQAFKSSYSALVDRHLVSSGLKVSDETFVKNYLEYLNTDTQHANYPKLDSEKLEMLNGNKTLREYHTKIICLIYDTFKEAIHFQLFKKPDTFGSAAVQVLHILDFFNLDTEEKHVSSECKTIQMFLRNIMNLIGFSATEALVRNDIQSMFNYRHLNVSEYGENQIFNVRTMDFESHENTKIRIPIACEQSIVNTSCGLAATILTSFTNMGMFTTPLSIDEYTNGIVPCPDN